jgi:serine/threonine-protein kinase
MGEGGESTARCPSCQAITSSGSFCSACGASLIDPASTPTVSSISQATGKGVSYAPPPSTPGSDPRSGERFLPGAVLAGRYRIVGLLGRGGMGEVYRADDLKLGQPVALKFLPRGLDQDARHLELFLNEVRSARQVSHPNVCRVFDVGEVEVPQAGPGQVQHYLSMEYVDGEDLASLLRRIGRLPQDKAIQIARQLCAGLAAAHEQGILHRDLKPANVMIDGRGRAKITDFGLAGLAEQIEQRDLRSGTPTYMAPEQLAGKEVTLRSDVYALGLVLYELFTGKRPFRADTPAELAQAQQESTPTTPSDFVEALDPVAERAIMRCLERDPAERPSSALAVAASFPGGDPLQAALAAGETPSPEIVAAAGPAGGMRPGVATACLVTVLVSIFATAFFADRIWLANRLPMEKSFEVLKANAREIIQDLGYDEPPDDRAASIELDMVGYSRAVQTADGPPMTEVIQQPNQPLVSLLYRQSPRAIVPRQLGGSVTASDPSSTPGDITVLLDLTGKLDYLRVTPERVERSEEDPARPDWPKLFEVAGLKLEEFEPTEPQLQPPDYADARMAWSGVLTNRGDTPVRIEAAALRGKPVYFRKVVPTDGSLWSGEDAQDFSPPKPIVVGFLVVLLLGFVLVAGGAIFLVVRSLRLGRGDRRGALRIAMAVFVLRMLHWTLTAHHTPSLNELYLAAVAISGALTLAVLFWGGYVALEPYVRRFWPESLVSWSRLLSGRFRDPLVGRDILVGFTVSAGLGAVGSFLFWLAESRALIPILANQGHDSAMQGGRFVIGKLFSTPLQCLSFASVLILLFLVLRLIARRTWLALVIMSVLWGLLMGLQFMMLQFARGPSLGAFLVGLTWGALMSVVVVGLLIRFGVLALFADFFCSLLVTGFAITADTSAPYFSTSLIGPLAAALLAVFAYRAALAGRALFQEEGAVSA